MNNGEVLVTEGAYKGAPGEVYDPATNAFRPMTLLSNRGNAIDSKLRS